MYIFRVVIAAIFVEERVPMWRRTDATRSGADKTDRFHLSFSLTHCSHSPTEQRFRVATTIEQKPAATDTIQVPQILHSQTRQNRRFPAKREISNVQVYRIGEYVIDDTGR